MEVSYELLWKICSGFLLSFLVSGLVSLILYCSNSTHDDVSDKKMVKSSIRGGKKKKKSVKFVDQVDEIRKVDDGYVTSLVAVEESGEKDEILRCGSGDGGVGLVDDGFVKDIEVDEVNSLVGVDESGEKDEILRGGSGDGGVGLVDLSGKGEIFVGFDEGVVERCVDVDMCLFSDVVDDQREQNWMNSSIELGSRENEVDKIVGCDVHGSLDSDELLDDQGEKNSMSSSNVYEDVVHDVDRVDGIVGCVVDYQRERNLANLSSVDEEERTGREFVGGENEVDRVDKSVELEGFEKDGVVYDVDVTLGSEELDNDKIVDDHDIDLVRGKEDARGQSNVGCKERSCGVFDEEEWEGIESSDLAKEFARAKDFVENYDKERRLAMTGGYDLMMQLYGLEKVAMEGPCHEPQPIAFKFASRVKWNAWQKLGNMSPEEAMEQYISILSQNVPEWMEGHSSEESKSHSLEEKVHSLADTHISASFIANLRTSKVSDLADVSTAVDQEKE